MISSSSSRKPAILSHSLLCLKMVGWRRERVLSSVKLISREIVTRFKKRFWVCFVGDHETVVFLCVILNGYVVWIMFLQTALLHLEQIQPSRVLHYNTELWANSLPAILTGAQGYTHTPIQAEAFAQAWQYPRHWVHWRQSNTSSATWTIH